MKSFETLCEKIPNPIGKRTTIQTILNEAVAMNLLLKYPCAKDKRIKFYKLTEDSEQTLKEWAEANIV
jgi:DNA-binding MarR family transcriptional regulator|tara:strand:- start:831 stop:1034 length:204 start_codon:yes stop_codon:yes gene_type:complete